MESIQTFEKPDKNFLKDKECLICLEPMHLEMNPIVKLPCGCANSAYHTTCILQLLESGKNKNFCPHCKTKYKILVQKTVPLSRVVPLVPLQNTYIDQLATMDRIMQVHVVSNSIMNFICVCVSMKHPSYSAAVEFPLLLISCIVKLMLNYCNLVYCKNNVEKVESVLIINYLFHLGQLMLIISVFTQINHNNYSMALLLNHLIFGFLDGAFRVITEFKMRNRVAAVTP